MPGCVFGKPSTVTEFNFVYPNQKIPVIETENDVERLAQWNGSLAMMINGFCQSQRNSSGLSGLITRMFRINIFSPDNQPKTRTIKFS
jgi:hypothetical protein